MGVAAGITRTLRRQNPAIAADYALDLERRGRTGMFPLNSREVHAATVFSETTVGRKTRLTIAAGAVQDRLRGGPAPYFSGRITRDIARQVRAEVWADRHTDTLASGQSVKRAGFTLTVRP